MKAVSTFVAVIILVVIVIGLGMIFSFWLSKFFRTQQTEIGSAMGKQQKCASAYPSIEEVRKNSVVISNPFDVELSNVIVYAETEIFGKIDLLKPYDLKVVTNTSFDLSQYSYVKVNALCLGEMLVSQTCKKGWECWKV